MTRVRTAWKAAPIAAGLVIAACAVGCATGDISASDSRLASGTRAVLRADFDRGLLVTGELQSVRSISIKSPQTSLFQMRIQFMAEEGSLVRKGEPLLEFDNSSLTDQVRSLETQILDAETQIVSKRAELASALKDLEIELAEREYEEGRARLDAEVDVEVLSRKEYAERQLAWTKAKRELQETHDRIRLTQERGQAELDVLIINRDKLKKDMLRAQSDRELLTILAPADGLVVYERRQNTTLRYQEGDSCWPGQGIIRLPDLSEMQVEFSVNEVDAPLLDVGMPVEVTVDAFPGRSVGGRITHIPSMAVKRDEASKVAVFKVRASLAQTWVGEMKPGMSARGRLVLERHEDAPLVSRAAVVVDGGVYRLRSDDSAGAPGPEIVPISRNERYYLISEEQYAALADRLPEVRRAGLGSP